MTFSGKAGLAAWLTVMLCGAAQAESPHQVLATLLDDFLAGASVNDAAMHDRFWSEDLIYTSSAGHRFGKAEILQSLSETEASAASSTYRADEVTVQVHDDIAVVTFRLIADMPDQSRSEFFNTGVFRLADEQWRAFVWQATRAAD